MTALRHITSSQKAPRLRREAGRGYLLRFVVLLGFTGDDRCKDRLEPRSWPTPTNPRVSGSHGTSENRGKLRGSKGKAVVPVHGRILFEKKKNAMRKIKLAVRYAMRKVFA